MATGVTRYFISTEPGRLAVTDGGAVHVFVDGRWTTGSTAGLDEVGERHFQHVAAQMPGAFPLPVHPEPARLGVQDARQWASGV